MCQGTIDGGSSCERAKQKVARKMRGVGGMILKTMWGFEHINMYTRIVESQCLQGGSGAGTG